MKKIVTGLVLLQMCFSCNYLDVVPDNIATIDYAFRTPLTAEKYLFTCYSWLPSHANYASSNPAISGADEIWYNAYFNESYAAFSIARGNQNVLTPYVDYWVGSQGGKPLFRGIRECNILLENIHKVKEMSEFDKDRMRAEAKVLKAYYHFWLMRMYGPIPIIRDNLDITAEENTIRNLLRRPVDECVDYIVELIDEASPNLPDEVPFEVQEKGRITKPIALAIKARVLVTAASPLFNGNTLFSGYTLKDGTPLFNSTYDETKWERAALACKEAIDLCHQLNKELNYYNIAQSPYAISDTTATELSIRTAITLKWNPEIIWGNTNSMTNAYQTRSYPRIFPGAANYYGGEASVPMKIVDAFYSRHGVPIEEDKTWYYTDRFELRTATAQERLFIQENYVTAAMNFDREPRFYASLAFDGSRWYGQGVFTDEDNFYITARAGGTASGHVYSYSATGYWPKKVVNHLNAAGPTLWTVQTYPWPVIRLADLYLLYAEALNEAYGPSQEVYDYLNLIRQRAGLGTVEESWTTYSTRPDKYQQRSGLREIIRRERTIELAFEGSRFWDLRRWMTAPEELSKPIVGWDVLQEEPEAYYRQRVLFERQFRTRDYFWPVQESELLKNRDIMQSPGW